ncbi:hypothetical protein GLOTRDRAFT_111949 [Gloeophyllum trabeum ATCC 11539]|uniref:C3H1-type domain-containing protein n=1 Tax=Gloeophyllum trabeum (strain ATCC 11539 / FP-39264 / Madison 617) TaxID=670483 RepID=S7RL22_GLOTA|nr:uncharacterized protein GLOTRDRAFT_111949 [Gloeophyllum trabeum ATCC 11539]EPQ53369.1 hypothetical protein GLOTRDRAFT_111949 [Gloeophyllum trabeum ATCC 11539]
MYEMAEEAATSALKFDPGWTKARYRRGLARKGMEDYAAAMMDFHVVLKLDPSCADAQKEHDIVADLCMGDWDHDADYIYPPPDEHLWQNWEEGSDSSDFNHEGSNIPCRWYNRDGCKKGRECPYSHAPDAKSVRDKLGRNVCVFHVMNKCKFGETRCVYSHDLRYLPDSWAAFIKDKGRVRDFWELYLEYQRVPDGTFAPWAEPKREQWLPEYCRRSVEEIPDDISALWRTKQKGQRRKGAKDKGKRQGKGKGKGRGKDTGGWEEFLRKAYWDHELEREAAERADNYGFTRAEVDDLLCQGVKPWDEDAWDVMQVLNGDFF